MSRKSPLLTSSDTTKSPAARRYRLYRGLYARLARRLGVDRSYVSRVASGQRRSAKIEKAIAAELRRIERA